MKSIFYDLETTDLNCVGQILNFAFVVVDQDYNEVETFAEKIRVSRLQLPTIQALLANKTDILVHQEVAKLTEYEAVAQIDRFFKRWLDRERAAIPLIGFNSSGFDLKFLRTVFIRNGFNPYYNWDEASLVPRDVILAARYAAATNQDFAKCLQSSAGESAISFKLESLAKALKLLDNEQEHESLADVRLTIALAKKLHTDYGIDVRTLEPYQIRHLHQAKRGEVFVLSEPARNPLPDAALKRSFPAVLHCADKSRALWIDLEAYQSFANEDQSPKSALRYFKISDSVLFSEGLNADPESHEVALQALTKLKELTLDNFFEENPCDIEQFIYRIPFRRLEELSSAMGRQDNPPGFSKDMLALVRRFWLENYAGGAEEEFRERLTRYAQYRYGGKMILGVDRANGGRAPIYHPTLEMLVTEIEQVIGGGGPASSIAKSLLRFYKLSELLTLFGVPNLQHNS